LERHEVHFFDKERNFRRGLDWYSKQMPKAGIDDVRKIKKTFKNFQKKFLILR